MRPSWEHINKACGFPLVSARNPPFVFLSKSLGNSALGRLWDPQSAVHVSSDARMWLTNPQTPKPFTHDLDTYLKFQNLEYDYHHPVSRFWTNPNVRYGPYSQQGPCPHGGITLSDSLTPSLTVLSATHPEPLGTPVGQFGTPSGSPAEL